MKGTQQKIFIGGGGGGGRSYFFSEFFFLKVQYKAILMQFTTSSPTYTILPIVNISSC